MGNLQTKNSRNTSNQRNQRYFENDVVLEVTSGFSTYWITQNFFPIVVARIVVAQ